MVRVINKILESDAVLHVLFVVMCLGLYYSRALVSISTGIFMALGILALIRPGAFSGLKKDHWSIALMLIFLVYLASGINSTHTTLWFEKVITNLPYLAIPLGLHAFGPLLQRQVVQLLGIFIGVTCLSAVIILFDYIPNFTEYNEIYLVGKTIPTPIIHVRYSYFLALAIIMSAGILLEGSLKRSRRKVLLGATAFLVIFIHLLAVRTGLFALYGGVLALVVVFSIREKDWKPAALSLAGMMLVSVIAYQTMPSLANKIGYMQHDLRMLKESGVLPQYSDNARVTSILYGLDLFVEHPIAGVGIGDMRHVMQQKYLEADPEYPENKQYLPISQYVYWLAAMGLVGTIVLMGLLLFPLIHLWNRSYLLVGLYGCTLFSFMAETSIQLQLGKTLFLLLVLTIIQQWRGRVAVQSVFAPPGARGHDAVQ